MYRYNLGKIIMKEIDFYLEQNTDKNAYVCLIANEPADALYSQFVLNIQNKFLRD